MQSRNKPVDAVRDILPIRQPVARKSEGDIGIADAALEEADTSIGYALPRAAGQEMLGRIRFKYQVLALIRRVVTKSTVGQSWKTGDGLRHKLARVDCLNALH